MSLQEVIIGRRQDDDIEITHGLSGNEQFVVKGAGFLNDNDMVRLAK